MVGQTRDPGGRMPCAGVGPEATNDGMTRLLLYRILSGTLGLACLLFGLLLVLAFVGYQRPFSEPGIPTGPVGYYFVAFTGCALVGWAGGLLAVARRPRSGRTIGTVTALALVLMAVVRMLAWLVGDYAVWLGELPRIEAAVLLLLALAFVWLRPRPEAA
jgi:hypothetical protein